MIREIRRLWVYGLCLIGGVYVSCKDEQRVPLPQQLEQACEKGEAQKCFKLAVMYAEGNEVERDDERAASYHVKACEAGVGDACARLGTLHHEGRGVPQSDGQALQSWQKGCELGSSLACYWLGLARERSIGTARDNQGAKSAWEKGCAGGEVLACYKLGGSLMSEGQTEGALDLWERACGLGAVEACLALGIIYYDAELVKRDDARAAQLLQRACDGRADPSLAGEVTLTDGCYQLGLLYRKGEGVGADCQMAVELWRKACDGKLEASCKLVERASASLFTDCQRATACQLECPDGSQMKKKGRSTYCSRDGVPHGPYVDWDDESVKRAEWIYRDGKKNGPSTSWFACTNVYEASYEDDQLNGPVWHWYEEGPLRIEAHYLAGELHGAYKQYYRSGQVLLELEYRQGKPCGDTRCYETSGRAMPCEQLPYFQHEAFSQCQSTPRGATCPPCAENLDGGGGDQSPNSP